MRRAAIAKLRAAAGVLLLAAALALPERGSAAEETVADIRAELTLLNAQIQEIREALVATGPARGLPRDPASALQRVDQLEAALRRLTDRVDVLTNDLNRIVAEASNRIDDIEFRLTELEGGDVSLLGEGGPLGGGLSGGAVIPPPPVVSTAPEPAADPAEAPGQPVTGGDPTPFVVPQTPPAQSQPPAEAPQLAVAEQDDFDAARAALEAGRHAEAVERLEAFLVAYPGGPLSGEAQLLKGEALAAQGAWRDAARAYLDAFSGAPEAATAPRALHGLAVSLGELGQTEEACLTFAEIDIRYPGSEVAAASAEDRVALGCP